MERCLCLYLIFILLKAKRLLTRRIYVCVDVRYALQRIYPVRAQNVKMFEEREKEMKEKVDKMG